MWNERLQRRRIGAGRAMTSGSNEVGHAGRTAPRDLSAGLVSGFHRNGGEMTRDFVGYGAEPPHAQWPGGARIAVNFVINFEEGSELSYPAGDGVSEGGLTEMLGTDLGVI